MCVYCLFRLLSSHWPQQFFGWFLWVKSACISYLLLHSKFPPNQMDLDHNIHYLTFSVGQASTHSLAGYSGSGSLRGCNWDGTTCDILRFDSGMNLSEADLLGFWQNLVLWGWLDWRLQLISCSLTSGHTWFVATCSSHRQLTS